MVALLCCGKVSQNFKLKTKLTNTNRTLVKPETAIEQNRCYK